MLLRCVDTNALGEVGRGSRRTGGGRIHDPTAKARPSPSRGRGRYFADADQDCCVKCAGKSAVEPDVVVQVSHETATRRASSDRNVLANYSDWTTPLPGDFYLGRTLNSAIDRPLAACGKISFTLRRSFTERKSIAGASRR